MADLFQRIDDRKDEWNIEVIATFLEIYNEEIRDLLSEPGMPIPRGGLQIREDKSVKVVGLAELRPTSAEEVKQIVLQGNSRRTQSPTHANETSSRSHAVLQVHVTQAPRTASLTEQRTMATLSIIDLAGSERAAATSNMGQRMIEGANINKSLLALGNCINALCESGGAVRHVPYRNSKLTRLLKFSLGGNCKTVMVVCIAPTSLHFDDTHNTLLYAERATKIKTKVVTRNVVNVDRHVGQYVEAINRLNLEVAQLKAKLAGKITAENDILKRKRAEATAQVDSSKKDVQERVEQTQANICGGGSCAGKISAAETKLAIIRSRLAQIDAMAPSLSSDLEAERALLTSLTRLEESLIAPDSPLVIGLSRSQNARNMFEATLRAVSERRSDKLEELHINCIKSDANWRKAEIERVRTEAERDAIRESLRAQAEMLVSLLGMVGRCTVVLGETARSLEGRSGLEGMASALREAAQKNNDTFSALVGQTTATYAAQGTGALDAFTRMPSSSGVPSQPAKTSRKSMSYKDIAASPRRMYKSPRRSIRSSIGQPYRRASDKEKEKKVVQWKDEAGQGALDDGGSNPFPSIMFSDNSECVNGRSQSVTGSESEWEDERTDDSLNLSNVIVPASSSSSSANFNPSLSHDSTASKRPRASRLDPCFLKAKGASSLGCLQEADETSPIRRGPPLSDRSINREDVEALHIPKYRDRDGSPARRMPAATSRTMAQSKNLRRRSNIGPTRSEKARRRSSLQSPEDPFNDSAPRRVETIGRSPAKRPRRVSLLANASRLLRVKGPNVMSTTLTMPGGDANVSISADTSILPDSNMRPSSRPLWR